MNKPSFRPIAPLDVDDAALDRVNERLGVPTMVRPAARPAPSVPKTPASDPRRQEKLTVELPGYLMDAMKRDALDRRISVRYLVMLALQGYGLTIDATDLVPDARRSLAKSRTPASL